MSLKGNIEAKQEARGKINYLGYNEIQEKVAEAEAAILEAEQATAAANDVAERGVHYVDRLAVIEKALDEVFDDDFKSITKDSPEISNVEEGTYYDRTGNLEINTNYTTYHINASEDFELFFDGLAPLVAQEDDSIHSEMLYLNIYDNFWANPSSVRVSEVFSTEGRSNNFPYSADRKLQVHAGELITISVAKKDPNNEYSNATIYFDGTEYVEGFLLRHNQGGVGYTLTDNVTLGEAQKREIMDELLELIAQGGLPASAARIVDVSIYANKWVGTNSPYSQVVAVEGATEYSQVDLTPSVEQLSVFHNKDLAFVTENVDGVVTVYAIGQKPENDYTIQATVKEVKI